MPTCTCKLSWVALKQLRTEFLEHCFERPAVFNRSWNGVIVLSASRVTYFVNLLLRVARAMDQDDNGTNRSSKSHGSVVALLPAFPVPDAKKTESS
ncbi:hypothetical protein Gpo141_00012315 [Globisporangium polare]